MNPIITAVSKERWKAAQEFELNCWLADGGDDDWNNWWQQKFGNYKVLESTPLRTILEVGCGPFAKNTRLILQSHPEVNTVVLNDPLLDQYFRLEKPVKKFAEAVKAKLIPTPLEDRVAFSELGQIDLCICINVLCHVMNIDECFKTILSLRPRFLILGQDLSNHEDLGLCPESWTDIGHPIKLDLETINKSLGNFNPKFKLVLSREQGRNPIAHYGTLLFVGEWINK